MKEPMEGREGDAMSIMEGIPKGEAHDLEYKLVPNEDGKWDFGMLDRTMVL